MGNGQILQLPCLLCCDKHQLGQTYQLLREYVNYTPWCFIVQAQGARTIKHYGFVIYGKCGQILQITCLLCCQSQTLAWTNILAFNRMCKLQIRSIFVLQALWACTTKHYRFIIYRKRTFINFQSQTLAWKKHTSLDKHTSLLWNQ